MVSSRGTQLQYATEAISAEDPGFKPHVMEHLLGTSASVFVFHAKYYQGKFILIIQNILN